MTDFEAAVWTVVVAAGLAGVCFGYVLAKAERALARRLAADSPPMAYRLPPEFEEGLVPPPV